MVGRVVGEMGDKDLSQGGEGLSEFEIRRKTKGIGKEWNTFSYMLCGFTFVQM